MIHGTKAKALDLRNKVTAVQYKRSQEKIPVVNSCVSLCTYVYAWNISLEKLSYFANPYSVLAGLPYHKSLLIYWSLCLQFAFTPIHSAKRCLGFPLCNTYASISPTNKNSKDSHYLP